MASPVFFIPFLKRYSLSKRSGVTLIELLIVIILSSITVLAMAVPFVMERQFWAQGRSQTESQRDAQLALRGIARVARESGCYLIDGDGSGVTFYTDDTCATCTAYVDGDIGAGTLTIARNCGAPYAVIDGVRSSVFGFAVNAVTASEVSFQIDVQHQNRNDETLVTEIYLRNAG